MRRRVSLCLGGCVWEALWACSNERNEGVKRSGRGGKDEEGAG